MTEFFGVRWIEPGPNTPRTVRAPARPPLAVAGTGPGKSSALMRRAAAKVPTAVRVTFLAFVAAIPFETVDLGPLSGKLSLARITGVFFFGAAFAYARVCFPQPPRPIYWFGAFLAVLGLWVFFIPRPFRSGQTSETMTIAQLLLFFWACSTILKDRGLVKAALQTFAVACFFLSISNILQIPGFVEKVGDPISGYRISALGYNLNELAALLGLAVLSCVGLVLDIARVKKWRRLAMLAITLPMLVVLVRTESRGGLLSLALALMFYLLPLGRPGRRLVGLLFGVTFLIGLVYLVASDPGSVRRWTKTYQQGDVAGRDKINKSARDMIKARPLFGWGPVAFTYELGPRTGHVLRDPHNLYIGTLAEVGIAGFVPLMVGLGLCTRAAWRARGGHFGLLPVSMVAMLLIGNLSGLWIQRKTMWFVLAFAVAAAAEKTRVVGPSSVRRLPLPGSPGGRLPRPASP